MRLHFKLVTVVIALITFAVFFTGCSKSSSVPKPVTPVTPVQDDITISSLSINQGHYNETVLVNGTGFSSVASDNKVFFNNKEAIVTAATTTQLTVTVPLSAGTGTVKVVNNDKTATGPSFTYNYTLLKTVLAGGGASGAINGEGASASFNKPISVVVNASGDLFIADKNNNLIRKVTKDGIVSTFAGNGTSETKDGTGTSSSFNGPSALTIDKNGNLFIAEYYAVRKITSEGLVSTIAGSGTKGFVNGVGKTAKFDGITGIAVSESGDLYVTDRHNGVIRKISSAGEVTTYKQTKGEIGILTSIAVDQANIIYVTEYSNFQPPFDGTSVYKVDASGTIGKLDIADPKFSYSQISGIAINKNNDKYILYPENQILKVSSTGVKNVISVNSSKRAVNSLKPQAIALYDLPGIAVDDQGVCYIADVDKNQIIKVGLQ